jgi:hypothetical protein
MIRFKWLKISLVAVVVSCGKELPELRDFDKASFVQDRNGCLNRRRSMVHALQREKDKLLALDEMQIVAVLGKPDSKELLSRNQKFYQYNLHPASQCADRTDTVSLKLIIRFNAVGLAKEVSVE